MLPVVTCSKWAAVSDEDLARALLGALMADEFGDAAANEHKFQRMVDEVHRIIASDAKARTLLSDTIRQIRDAS